MKIKFLIFLFLIFSLACDKKNSNNNKYTELLKTHPSTDSLNYPPIEGDWTNRIYNIDEPRISFVKKVNKIDKFDQVPTPSKTLPVMKEMIKSISNSFHPDIRKLFNKYIYGIYFCENLGGTGLTGFIYNNEKKQPVGGYIIIDSEVINQKANDWITFKENSAFKTNKINLAIKIETDENNTIENALRYIVLHEMGHVISNTLNITPDLRQDSMDYGNYPFFGGSWVELEKSQYDNKTFSLRSKIKFYSSNSNLLNLDENWNKLYPILHKTNFPTLYGATNALDHFAEAFVSYVHCIIDNKPWELSLYKDGKVIYKMKNRIFEMEKESEFLRRLISKL